MKKINLTTWERMQLIIVVGEHIPGKGTIAAVRLGCKALDILELTKEEKGKIGWAISPDSRITWRADSDVVWILEFSDDIWNFVQHRIEAYRDWSVDKRTNALLDKVLDGEEKNE